MDSSVSRCVLVAVRLLATYGQRMAWRGISVAQGQLAWRLRGFFILSYWRTIRKMTKYDEEVNDRAEEDAVVERRRRLPSPGPGFVARSREITNRLRSQFPKQSDGRHDDVADA